MSKRKAFLAKALAAALAVTTVLPGALTANAATIVTTTTKQNVETVDTWSVGLGTANIGGEAYWHLQSDATKNNNSNSDYSSTTAPAVILDMDADFTIVEGGDAKTVSVDIYPNGTAANMRFGIMVKYVDATHWAYLNYDVGSWLLEYKCDTLNNWPSITELSGASLEDCKDTTVTITYTTADQLDITYTPDGGETIEAVIDDDSFEGVLSALEEYAATAGEDGAALPVRFGFKAGTYTDSNNVSYITDVNLKNMNLDGESMKDDDWQWVRVREGQVFEDGDIIGGVNYSVLDGSEAEDAVVSEDTALADFENGRVSAIIRPTTDNQAFALDVRYTEEGAAKVGFDGTKWYYAVGDTKTEINDVAALAKDTDYVLAVNIEKGVLSANVAPVENEAAETTLAEDVDISALNPGSIALETAAGTQLWVGSINYTNKVSSEPEALQAAYDSAVEDIGETNTDNQYYSDTWETYKTALANAKKMLDSDEDITQNQANTVQSALTAAVNGLVSVNGEALQDKYEELAAEEQGLATDDSWAAFQAVLNDAKAVLDKIAAKESVASTDVSGALSDLNGAKALLVERAATTGEKTELQTGYDSVKDTVNNCYTEDSWNTFTAALEAAKNALESQTATNTQVAAALEALNVAKAGLTAKTASAEDLEALLAGYDSVKATTNANYTAESWKAFQDALKNVEAILAGGEEATQFEVQTALKALQDAKAGLKVAQTAVNNVKIAFAQAAYTVDATATVATKVDANAAVTYTSSDTSVVTVDAKGVVTGVKAGTAVITAAAGSVKATTTVTVTTPKITLTATSTKLQVKKSTKAIQVETKLDTDSVVSWKSSNTKVATVTKAGKVKAKKVGTTKLTVTMKSGATATCKLKVQKAKVVTKSIKVSSTKVTLSAGQTYTIGAKRNPITATEKITYTTSKKKVATVSKKGVITAKAKGTSKITVKCNGKKKVITVTVK